MKPDILINSFLRPAFNFVSFYQKFRIKENKITTIKYRLISTLDDYKKSKLIQLSFNDNPGDYLAPISIEFIKKTPDIIAGMHPIDINSVNDLYYLKNDGVVEMKITNDEIIATKEDGTSINYNISESIDISNITSARLSYMIGYMQAEKLLRDAYSSTKDSYKIIADNISTLEIKDINSNTIFLKNPLDILFSGEYKNFSKDDICRIGYICGQISQL